jgi:hypothetical protein
MNRIHAIQPSTRQSTTLIPHGFRTGRVTARNARGADAEVAAWLLALAGGRKRLWTRRDRNILSAFARSTR